jgi:FtsP/CotA-like multicopper oxidase with cupredoxin domain
MALTIRTPCQCTVEGWVVALDGQPLAAPAPLARLALAPAQRADLIVDVTAEPGGEALLVSHERDGGYAIASFAVAGQASVARRDAPAPLPANPLPPLGALDGARRVDLRMEGGAMGRMDSAMVGDERMDMRSMARAGMVWAFNGRAGMPDAPLLEAARGETVRIRMINDTAWPHAMHLHGHHFRRLDAAGRPGALRDTTLVERGETAEIAFVADNPGDWMLHCHMLEHAAAGMMTWLRVA